MILGLILFLVAVLLVNVALDKKVARILQKRRKSMYRDLYRIIAIMISFGIIIEVLRWFSPLF